MPATASGPTVLDMVGDYLTGINLKAMLLGNTFTFDKHNHAYRSSITGEVTGTGYIAGGVALTGVAAQQDIANSRVEIVADDANFGTLTVTGITQIAVYINTGVATADRIISVHTFLAESPAGENFTYAWFNDDANAATKGVVGYFTY